MSTAFIAAGSAILGAIAGGFAAALGNDWASVRQMRRAARVDMFENLLAQWDPWAWVRGTRDYVGPTADGILDALRRAAVVAGKTEAELVAKMRSAWEPLVAPMTDLEKQARVPQTNHETGETTPVPATLNRTAEKVELDAAVGALSYLEAQIS